MKVLHIESGLGNQMLGYCEYLAMKKANPDDNCYIENVVYEIPECENIISQWNGYELENVFGISALNIRELFQKDEWERIVQEISESEFWIKNWNYPVYISRVLNNHGLNLKNIRGNFESKAMVKKYSGKKSLRTKFVDTRIGNTIRRYLFQINKKKILNKYNEQSVLFCKTSDDLYTGQRLSFKYLNNGIERIEEEIRNEFVFAPISDDRNLKMLKMIQETESVSIHARRGDMLKDNRYCYQYGYFKRAVHLIKTKISCPVFIFFCDPGSVDWCKRNERVFGLDFSKDLVYFVEWNKGLDSYKDMQLMAQCKHNIITNSSFGWWGSYLNSNPGKITISPEVFINTKYHI